MTTSIRLALRAVAASGVVTLTCLGGAGAVAVPAVAARAARPPTAYVANSEDGTVTAINTATGKVLKTIAVGFNDTAIAISPDGKIAYVTNTNCGACNTAVPWGVTLISTATNRALRKISVNAAEIAITPNGKTAYVANCCNATGSWTR
jgi:YVTN family beta-propeller protein